MGWFGTMFRNMRLSRMYELNKWSYHAREEFLDGSDHLDQVHTYKFGSHHIWTKIVRKTNFYLILEPVGIYIPGLFNKLQIELKYILHHCSLQS